MLSIFNMLNDSYRDYFRREHTKKLTMARLTPKLDVLRALFARSGNQCAFPGCTQSLINDKNKFIGQVCHIEAAMPGGERYNPRQTDEERRNYDNLILMCYPHHIETDDVQEYPVKKLKKLKFEHELKFEKSDFKIDESALFKLSDEMKSYWEKVERLNTIEHPISELAFNINTKGSISDVFQGFRENISFLQDLFNAFHDSDRKLEEDFIKLLKIKEIEPSVFDSVLDYENPFAIRNWELHNLGVPNGMQRLNIDLMHIEIKYLEEYLKTNSKNQEARNRLEKLKDLLADLAQHAVVLD